MGPTRAAMSTVVVGHPSCRCVEAVMLGAWCNVAVSLSVRLFLTVLAGQFQTGVGAYLHILGDRCLELLHKALLCCGNLAPCRPGHVQKLAEVQAHKRLQD